MILILTQESHMFPCRTVWPSVPMLLCAFHVTKAWALNPQQKVSDKGHMEALRKSLDGLMRFNPASDPIRSPSRQARIEIEQVLAQHAETCPAFVEYFKRQWAPRPGKFGSFASHVCHVR